jgi:phosphatidylserine/phosphatidylglycerophosphate/cardiolipin synthase-like enzyme
MVAAKLLGGALEEVRVIAGLENTINECIRVIDTSGARLRGEVFVMSEVPVQDALRAATNRGVETRLLVCPEMDARYDLVKTLDGIGAKAKPHGTLPNKVHSKALVADRKVGVVSTGPWLLGPGKYRKDWLDYSVTFEGDAAAALDNLTTSSLTRGKRKVAVAAGEAAQHGIYLNDPARGVDLLSRKLQDMVTHASKRIVISVKRFSDKTMQDLVQQARDRGVEVVVADRASGWSKVLHGNMVMVDDTEAYIGSGMLNSRLIAGGGTSGRKARELGVVVRGKQPIADIKRALKEWGVWTAPSRRAAAARRVKQAVGGAA